jgi:hypothetical protein
MEHVRNNGHPARSRQGRGLLRTSEEALQRFSDSLTPDQQPSSSHGHAIRTTKQREREVALIDEQLDEIFGIKKCEFCQAEIVAPKGAIPKNDRRGARSA